LKFSEQIVSILQHVRDVYTNCLYPYCHKKGKKIKNQNNKKIKQGKDTNKQTNKQNKQTKNTYYEV